MRAVQAASPAHVRGPDGRRGAGRAAQEQWGLTEPVAAWASTVDRPALDIQIPGAPETVLAALSSSPDARELETIADAPTSEGAEAPCPHIYQNGWCRRAGTAPAVMQQAPEVGWTDEEVESVRQLFAQCATDSAARRSEGDEQWPGDGGGSAVADELARVRALEQYATDSAARSEGEEQWPDTSGASDAADELARVRALEQYATDSAVRRSERDEQWPRSEGDEQWPEDGGASAVADELVRVPDELARVRALAQGAIASAVRRSEREEQWPDDDGAGDIADELARVRARALEVARGGPRPPEGRSPGRVRVDPNWGGASPRKGGQAGRRRDVGAACSSANSVTEEGAGRSQSAESDLSAAQTLTPPPSAYSFGVTDEGAAKKRALELRLSSPDSQLELPPPARNGARVGFRGADSAAAERALRLASPDSQTELLPPARNGPKVGFRGADSERAEAVEPQTRPSAKAPLASSQRAAEAYQARLLSGVQKAEAARAASERSHRTISMMAGTPAFDLLPADGGGSGAGGRGGGREGGGVGTLTGQVVTDSSLASTALMRAELARNSAPKLKRTAIPGLGPQQGQGSRGRLFPARTAGAKPVRALLRPMMGPDAAAMSAAHNESSHDLVLRKPSQTRFGAAAL